MLYASRMHPQLVMKARASDLARRRSQSQCAQRSGSAAALAIIEQHSLATQEAEQIELDIRLPRVFALKGAEQERNVKRINELLAGDKELKVRNHFGLESSRYYPGEWAHQSTEASRLTRSVHTTRGYEMPRTRP